MPSCLRGGLLAAGLATVALAACGPQAQALSLTTGFSADPVLTGTTASNRAVWIPRAVGAGARLVRVNVLWSQVAPHDLPAGFNASDPSSPGYDWTGVDAAVRDLTNRGLGVLLTVWSAPRWAEGAGRPAYAPPGSWRPDATQFGEFATAIATRYDGGFAGLPRVRYYEAWNEPNLDLYLTPQWTQAGTRFVPSSPAVYRALLNSFYGAVKRVSSSNLVLGGATSPYGDTAGADPPGQERMQPVAFDRYLFCLNGNSRLSPSSCPDPPHLDALDHHPYGVQGPTWHALNADDAAVPDVYKLARVLDAARRDHHVLPGGRKRLWVTEISWDSNPPDPRGVPIQRQARWYEQAMYVLWKQRVDTILFLQLADQPCTPDCGSSYQAGLYYMDGRPKPSLAAVRFPFLSNRLSHRRVQAWGLARRGGTVRIEVLRGRRWTAVRRLRVRPGRVFLANLPIRGRALLRAQLGPQTSLAWSQSG